MGGGKAVSPERKSRQAWLAGQLHERKQQREREEAQQLASLEREHERLWEPFARQASRSGELNIAWQHARGFFTWERVLPLRDLLALRVTGHELHELPEALPEALPALQTLSLIADGLEKLPINIGALQHLIELDLTKNRLRELPASLTQLTALTALNLSCNLLEKLPDDFGSLDKLEKLWLESNELTVLPASIGRCRSARCANFSGNRLTELPATLGDLTNLTTLSVNLNELSELPEALSKLPNLRILHASRNQLTKLPRNMGEMQALRELRLDWNAIRELPFSFRALSELQVLCMEQNPLRLPPGEYVARGVAETFRYMEKALADFQRSSRREIVEALQALLAFAAQRIEADEIEGQRASRPSPTGNAETLESNERSEPGTNRSANATSADLNVIMALFEPNCARLAPTGSGDLQLYGVVWDCFYSELLPSIERLQELATVTSADNLDPSVHQVEVKEKPESELGARPPSFAERFTREEVEDALLHYDDDFGTAHVAGGEESDGVLVEFRRCACVDPVALRERDQRVRKVCLPRAAPYRCQRPGRLLRAQMLTREEAQDQLASTYLRAKVARLTLKTRRRAVDFINSSSGVAHFERTARVLARATAQRRRRLRKLHAQHQKAMHQLEVRRAKLQRKCEALKRIKTARVKALQVKLAQTEKDHDLVARECEAIVGKDRDGPVAKKKLKKLAKVNEKLGKLRTELEEAESEVGGPEDAKIAELELAMEGVTMAENKLVAATEKARAREMESEADGGDDEEDEEEEEEEEEEGADVDDASEEEDEEDDEDESEAESSEVEDESTVEVSTSGSGSSDSASNTPFFQFDMPDMAIIDYRKAAIQAVDRELEIRANSGEEVANKSSVETAMVVKLSVFTKPLDVSEEELLELFQTHLRDAYVEMQCSKVAQQATREFLQMRAVLQRWQGMASRAIFEAWRDLARASRLDASAVRAKAERKKLLAEQNRALEEQLARVEARRWVQRSDMYSDALYYEHVETGETRWEPPAYWLEEFERKQEEDKQQQQTMAREEAVPPLRLPPI